MELAISRPGETVEHIELQDDVLRLGRAADNDLAYPDDPWLSRYHLSFHRKDGLWYVKDCNSRNGTLLNAVTLDEPQRVRGGDRIYAGHLVIEITDALDPIDVVSFVAHANETPAAVTVVTNLDKVLRDSARAASLPHASTLNNSRMVNALIRAGQELAGHQTLDELFPVILDLALAAMEAQRGVILTLEGNDLFVRASRGHQFSISTSVRDRILREKCSLIISDAQADIGLRKQESILVHRVRSMIAVPLQAANQVIGLIYVDNGSLVRPFKQDDLDLLTVLANVAAIRIENARLTEVEQQERLMALELSQASEIQQSLLPAAAPVIEGYDLAGQNLPCRTVGGDYYDFIPYADGRLGLIVADVSGKGLPAALMMSSLQARVQMLVETQPDPASALSTLNRNLAARCPSGKFITLFYALLNIGTGAIAYCNAGHNYPLIIRAAGGVEALPGSNMVLGIMPQAIYTLRETYLGPGDVLVLYSDGVTEARSPSDQEFGEEGLSQFLANSRTCTAAESIAALSAHLRNWCHATSFHDDFTIVLVKRQGAPAPSHE